MTGRYGGGRKAPAADFSAPDSEDTGEWEPKHDVVIRRISKGGHSDTLSVRNMLPPEWVLVRIKVVKVPSEPDRLTWELRRVDNGDRPNTH